MRIQGARMASGLPAGAASNCPLKRAVRWGPVGALWVFNLLVRGYLLGIDVQFKTISGSEPRLNYAYALPEGSPPEGLPRGRLIILHGYGDHSGRHEHVLQAMAARGLACYALDFRGHGRSAGKPGFVRHWDEHLQDLSRFLAIEELRESGPPIFVLGHSHGGLIAVAAGMRGQLNQCRGVILVAPYLRLKMPVPRFKRMLGAVGSHLFPSLAIKSGLNGPMLTRDQQMIERGRNDPYCRGIATPRWFTEAGRVQREVGRTPEKFSLPLLMLLPGEDTVADERASEAFFDRCRSSDKTVIAYPGNRHELLRELDREKVFVEIDGWINQRLAGLNVE
jgi:alpha-beta hydrolase superfamily lysophospholipase